MDSLFGMYRYRKTGTVGGKTWGFSQGMSGTAGSIVKNGSDISIIFDAKGAGVSTKPTGTVVPLKTGAAGQPFNMKVTRHSIMVTLAPGLSVPSVYTCSLFSTDGRKIVLS